MQEDLLLPVLTHINDRIFAYEIKLNKWKALETKATALNLEEEQKEKLARCRQQLQAVLDGYNDLHQQLLARNTFTTGDLVRGEALLAMEKQDLQFTESECGAMLVGGEQVGGLLPTNEDLIKQRRQAVRQARQRQDYQATVTAYEQLEAAGDKTPPYDLTFAYGQALMKTGQEEKARDVFSALLARIRRQDQAQWEFKLMQLIGDLEFALGKYEPAQKQYTEITDLYAQLNERNDWARQQLSALGAANEQTREVRDYAALLRSFLAYNPDRDGFSVVRQAENFVATYPYSLVSSSADKLVTISRQRAEKWYKELLRQVDDLVTAEQYEDALLTIEAVPRTILPVEKQQELADLARKIRTTKAMKEEEERLAREQAMQENWNTAMTHLRAREYDQAIESFRKLLGTEYEEKARKRIDEAANLAASEDRKRAAELFVRSGRTHDLESRKRLLMASRQLLQDILIKYPQATLVPKAKRNLKRIEEEIRAIDPTLLETPVTVEGTPLPGHRAADSPEGEANTGSPPATGTTSGPASTEKL